VNEQPRRPLSVILAEMAILPHPHTPNCVSSHTASRKPASFFTVSNARPQAWAVASAILEASAPSAIRPITSFHRRVAGSGPIRMRPHETKTEQIIRKQSNIISPSD
jgi:hypothetical protein